MGNSFFIIPVIIGSKLFWKDFIQNLAGSAEIIGSQINGAISTWDLSFRLTNPMTPYGKVSISMINLAYPYRSYGYMSQGDNTKSKPPIVK